MTVTMPKTDPATERVILLLTELATDAPHFMQPWERTPWMNKQVDAFLTLYKKFQGNKRVRDFLTVVDGGSRTDSNVEDAVYRARKIAPQCLKMVLDDVNETLFSPTPPKSGDPVYDQWSDGRHVERSDGLSSEWGRTAVREANKGIEYETSFRGYVEPKK